MNLEVITISVITICAYYKKRENVENRHSFLDSLYSVILKTAEDTPGGHTRLKQSAAINCHQI